MVGVWQWNRLPRSILLYLNLYSILQLNDLFVHSLYRIVYALSVYASQSVHNIVATCYLEISVLMYPDLHCSYSFCILPVILLLCTYIFLNDRVSNTSVYVVMYLYKPYSLLYAALPNHLREHWSGIITHWNTEMGLLLMYHSHSLTHCCWLNLPTLLCVCTCTEMVWDWTAMGYGEIARDRLVYIRSGAEADPSIWHRAWFLRVPQMDGNFHLWVTVLPAFCGLLGEFRSGGLIVVWWRCCEGGWVFVTGISASGINFGRTWANGMLDRWP